MSKKVDEINSEYISKAEAARRTLNNAVKLNITYFPGVTEVMQGHYDDQGKWQTDAPKYQYNGWGVRNTYSEANHDRNADIDSKISILDSRIGYCNSRKGELNTIINECNESLSNLNSDISILNGVQASFQRISQGITSITSQFGNVTNGVYNTYQCNLKNLNQGTSSAISTAKSGLASSAISDGISKLEKYRQMAENIKQGVTSLISQLDEKISELEAQKSSFQGMKQ